MIGAELLSGVTLATFAASGIFFLKFWKASREKFFLFFCVACWLLAGERVALLVVEGMQQPVRTPLTESNSWVYLLRLLAFVFILIAAIERNRKKRL